MKLKKKVDQSPKGYVFDGWPRYMEQVNDMLKAQIGYDRAVFLNVSKEEVMKEYKIFFQKCIKNDWF